MAEEIETAAQMRAGLARARQAAVDGLVHQAAQFARGLLGQTLSCSDRGAVELPIARQRNAFVRYFHDMRGRQPLDAHDQAVVVSQIRTIRRARASSSTFFGTMPAPCNALGNDAKAKSFPGL